MSEKFLLYEADRSSLDFRHLNISARSLEAVAVANQPDLVSFLYEGHQLNRSHADISCRLIPISP